MNLDDLRKDYDIVPIARELSADAITPVAAFAALSGDGEAFLFESVERGENVGRYSFVGFEPRRSLRFDESTPDPVGVLNNELQPLRVYGEETLPPFFGGAVVLRLQRGRLDRAHPGFVSKRNRYPDARFFFDNVVVFDHVKQRLYVIANIFTSDAHASIEEANARLDRAIERLRAARVELLAFPDKGADVTFSPNIPREDFEAVVRTAKEEIVSGEIFQIVLSQRWSTEFCESDALTLYRVLRSINPSPYMFLLRTPECTLVGASPEMLVRVDGTRAETRPIAGTRPRGATPAEDAALERASADPRAGWTPHAGRLRAQRSRPRSRQRLGLCLRLCPHRALQPRQFRHHRSNAGDDRSPVDLFLSCFPAGTLTGAPKIRAMELIDAHETTRRGPYGGAVAYFGFSGNMDSCIAIRTIVLAKGYASVQAGAGIVYDSDPAREYEEAMSKSAALKQAISVAKKVLG
jgi:anthranilate synthase component 1